jgi:tRNA pseudouridine synthase 10
VQRQRIAYWKETHFEKVYRAEVAVAPMPAAERLDAAARFQGEIVQRTPQRVAYRRADLDRSRRLRVLGLAPLREGVVELRILCEHGTYVKEWISGDEGRTRPSLQELLGVECRCSLLDVEEIMTADVPGPRLDAPSPTEP